MANHLGYIPLDSIITDYLDESEQSLNKYAKCYNMAFRALDELGMDYFYKVQSVKLPVLPNLTVKFPDNFLSLSKLGVLNDKGEIIPLAINDNLTTYADLLPNRTQVTQDNKLMDLSFYNFPVFYNYWDGFSDITHIYGIPSGSPFIGSYKIDLSNGIILLGQDFCYRYVIMEYVCSPNQEVPQSVPIQFREAIIAYLRWKDIISIPSKTHVHNSNVSMRRHDFYNERRLAQARWRPFDLADAYQRALKDSRMAVKAG